MGRPQHARRWRWLPALTFAVLAITLLVAGQRLDHSLRAGARARASAELDAVATLKVRTLRVWIAGRLDELQYVAGYPTLNEVADAASRGPVDPHLLDHARTLLAGFGEGRHFLRVAMLGRDGRVLLDWLAPGAVDHPLDEEKVKEVLGARAMRWSLLDHDGRPRPWLDAAIPVGGPASSVVLAARADPGEAFEEILDRWPVPSVTAITALVRRDGDQARVLGSPSNLPQGGRTLSVPLSDRARPAAQAVLGTVGLTEGTGYLGHPVLAAIRPVEGTDWKLLTRMDLAEVEAPVLRPAQVIFGLVGMLLVVGAGLTLVWWRTDLKRARAEDEVAEGAERLRLALGDTLYVWDWDLVAGRLIGEPRWSAWLGTPTGPLHGSIDEILRLTCHPDDLEVVKTQLLAHLRGELPRYAVECRFVPPDGRVRWLRIRGEVMRRGPDGTPQLLVGVISDVTEQRADQARLELGERMASLGTLAAGVAHELNNPLSAVVGSLDLLAGERAAELPADLREAAEDARDAASRMREVLGGLRAFSRGGAERRAVVAVEKELEAALRLAGNQLRHRARVEVELGPLPGVLATRHQLGQVFLNLLVNAAEALPEGHVSEHRVRVRGWTDPEGWAVVEISDTGAGIPREHLPRLFEPFFTTRAEGVGTGLGLAIVHAIVEAAGGRIEVESEVGHGSTFRVRLPPAAAGAGGHQPDLTPAPASLAVAASVPGAPGAPPSAPPRPRRRVLVIDDEPLVARAVVRALQRDCDVEAVHSGAEGLVRLLGGARYDAVLCDLMMPEMTGMELCARLEAVRPELARRLVFVTGGTFTAGAADFLARTTRPCLEKPLEPAALRRAIERAAAQAG